MSDNQHSVSHMEVRHVPDYSVEVDSNGIKHKVDLPGHYLIGAVVDGAFVPLSKIGAPRLHKHIERAKQTGPQSVSDKSDE